MKALLICILVIVSILVVIGVSIFSVSAISSQPLTKQDVQQSADMTYSLIAETLLLDQQIEQQKVTTPYSQVYLKDLQQPVDDAAQQLDTPANSDVQAEVNEQKQTVKQLKYLLSQSLLNIQSPIAIRKTISALRTLENKESTIQQSL